jgi:hypothetical protein
MPEYGKADYWNDRYRNDKLCEPFDWLFSFDDIEKILNILIPQKTIKTLIVGCGNAPFSPDM